MSENAILLTVIVISVLIWWTQRSVSASETVTDSGGDDTVPQGDSALSTISVGTSALAMAIATAEGFGVPGAIPTRAHNPGDLVIPNWPGESLGAEGISVFDSDADGWRRLFHQLELIRTGQSRVYRAGMTLTEFAQKWTATEQTIWRDNVIASLQEAGFDVSEWSTLREILL